MTLGSVIFDTLNAIPGLEGLPLSDGTFQGFLEGIKEEETLVPKLSQLFILDARGRNGAIIILTEASRW